MMRTMEGHAGTVMKWGVPAVAVLALAACGSEKGTVDPTATPNDYVAPLNTPEPASDFMTPPTTEPTPSESISPSASPSYSQRPLTTKERVKGFNGMTVEVAKSLGCMMTDKHTKVKVAGRSATTTNIDPTILAETNGSSHTLTFTVEDGDGNQKMWVKVNAPRASASETINKANLYNSKDWSAVSLNDGTRQVAFGDNDTILNENNAKASDAELITMAQTLDEAVGNMAGQVNENCAPGAKR